VSTWTNWAELASASPVEERTPVDAADVVAAVVDARSRGLRVKMPGSGHSFGDIAVTDGLMLHPGALRGITAVDRAAMTVTVRAGTPLHELNLALERLGLALHNIGDIDVQTVAGAVSTGTHGTGGQVASLSALVRGVEVVDGHGALRRVDADHEPELLPALQLGLGALGVLVSVTLAVEPLFTLQAHERPLRWGEAVATFDELVAEHDHAEMYWFPHTDRLLAKLDDRSTEPPAPLPRWREWTEDVLLANRVFSAMQALGNRVPPLVRPLNGIAVRALGERRFRDVSHRVFTSPRQVRFRETEHAVPREAGMAALSDLRRLVERSGWRISFPVEVRSAPADSTLLSPASDRDSIWIACHVNGATDHTAYFEAAERVLRAHGGRPHWGKLHTRTASDLAPVYPRWQDFQDARDRLDPDRLFANPYLDRVLGP
jgi:FAD-linked oxidoreductase